MSQTEDESKQDLTRHHEAANCCILETEESSSHACSLSAYHENLNTDSAEESCMNEENQELDPALNKEIHDSLDASQAEDFAVHSSSDKKREKAVNPHFDAFMTELSKQANPEVKLQLIIDFMEASLAQTGSPQLKSFWDARTVCLQLFKENVSPALRANLWAKYTELSKEARRLKELLDEQSAFAAEQIEIAIQALEADIANIASSIEKMGPVDFGGHSEWMSKKYPIYEGIQRELNLLNTQASRVNALRKELIRTEMRIRLKNKFFQRLSAIGDSVFPRRKELIKEISTQFSDDVDSFISQFFTNANVNEALFFLREEIKSLQGLAKVLTLNTHSFTHTRMRLSECWDKLKVLDKERKKERAQMKAAFKQNYDSVLEKIHAFNQAFANGEIPLSETQSKIDAIAAFMREVELGREEISSLREELNQARKPVYEKLKAQEDERSKQDQERERLKRQKIEELKRDIDHLVRSADSYDVEKILSEREALIEKINTSATLKAEKNDMERMLKPLKDVIVEKQEKAMMNLSEDDKQALQQLKEVLAQRKERRLESKNLLESIRKASGSSGYDFEQGLKFQEQIAQEKERLTKADQGIFEIERKIAELQKKVRSLNN